MAQRKTIALIFSYNEGWIAGSYYVMNLVHALKTLPSNEMPRLFICASKKDFAILKNETEYPFLNIYDIEKKLPLHKRLVNLGSRLLLNRNRFENLVKNKDISFLYPFNNFPNPRFQLLKTIYWIPDFQDKVYPQYFDVQELEKRDAVCKNILYNDNIVVFSSNTILNEAVLYFPEFRATPFVIPFAVTIPTVTEQEIQATLTKFNLPDYFFFCPNQFWQHKNHFVVLKALAELKKQNIIVQILFSGREEDYRNLEYVKNIKSFCRTNDIENSVRFLGFLDRKDQICIFKKCIAVIQPSLYEGWSTVVEDCKALNKYILVSEINVHIEQIQSNCDFFSPDNELQLAQLMRTYFFQHPEIKRQDYRHNVTAFAQSFMKMSKQLDT